MPPICDDPRGYWASRCQATHSLLKFAHILGTVLIGAGLIGVWLADLRSRQVRELGQFAEAVRNIAVYYDGVVVPGALLLLGSGGWLERARAESVPTFTHFLDLPVLLIIVALGTLKPETWTLFVTGCIVALAIAAVLTVYVPRLYPWGNEKGNRAHGSSSLPR